MLLKITRIKCKMHKYTGQELKKVGDMGWEGYRRQERQEQGAGVVRAQEHGEKVL